MDEQLGKTLIEIFEEYGLLDGVDLPPTLREEPDPEDVTIESRMSY